MYIINYMYTMYQLYIHILQQFMLHKLSINDPTLQQHMQIVWQ